MAFGHGAAVRLEVIELAATDVRLHNFVGGEVEGGLNTSNKSCGSSGGKLRGRTIGRRRSNHCFQGRMSFAFSAESTQHFQSAPAEKVHYSTVLKKPSLTRDLESGVMPVLGVKTEKSRKTEKIKEPKKDVISKRPEKQEKKKKNLKNVHKSTMNAGVSKGGSSVDLSAFKKYAMAAAIILILLIPVLLNIEIVEVLWPSTPGDYNSDAPQILEGDVSSGASDIVSSKVTGAEKDEVMGSIKVTKNCGVSYTDDPNRREDVVATRICPEMHDVDIVFSIKGVYGTHPNANKNGPTLVGYVVTGGSVWTTFFDQHSTTKQAYTIPPGQELPISVVFGPGVKTLPPLYDAVKVVHSMYFMQKVVGVQSSFPTCVMFYASLNPIHSTRGVMACQTSKKKAAQTIDLELLRSLNLVDHRGEMPELAYIVPGSRTSVKIEFAPDQEGLENPPIKEVELAVGQNSMKSGNVVYDAEEHRGAEWKLRPKVIIIAYFGEPTVVPRQSSSVASIDTNSNVVGPTINQEENE